LIQRCLSIIAIVLFVTSSFALAQSANGAAQAGSAPEQSPPQSASTSAGASAVSPNAPVITIDGVCDVSLTGVATTTRSTPGTKTPNPAAAASTAGSTCKTQVTRAEFENLLKVVAPTAPATVHRQIASRYVQLLTAANEGVKLGVNKDPQFDEQLALGRLQLLAQSAERKLQSEATNVSEAEEKAYYDQNSSAFEEVTLTRVFIPRENTPAAGSATPAAPDAKAIADSARQQLASGEDADKVQKSVYDQLKNTTSPPSTKFGSKRRGGMAPDQETKIFSLKQGEVSEVMPDPMGFVVYRLDSKQQLPFDQAKDDIKRRLAQQHIEDSRQKILNASKADYNDAYFGPESASPHVGPAGRPSSRPPASAPPAGANQTPSPANPK